MELSTTTVLKLDQWIPNKKITSPSPISAPWGSVQIWFQLLEPRRAGVRQTPSASLRSPSPAALGRWSRAAPEPPADLARSPSSSPVTQGDGNSDKVQLKTPCLLLLLNFHKQFSVQSGWIIIFLNKNDLVWNAEFKEASSRLYPQGDDEHAAVEAAVSSHRVLLLCDHHQVHRTCEMVVVPHRCWVHTPGHTHTIHKIKDVAANSALTSKG